MEAETMNLAKLRNLLKDPATRALDVNSPDMTIAHRQILLNKKMLRHLFQRFYAQCRTLDERYFGTCTGRRVELGSGSSIIKEFWPDVVTTDIKPLPFVDMVVDAQDMPFEKESLRALYGINLFHHLPNPRAFFNGLLRVLQPGGGAILIEPYFGPLARKLFVRLHDSEGFDMSAPGWENYQQVGPCAGANQALSGIVFHRDRAIFEREFPGLELVADLPHTHLTYLLSGGVNFRQLVPNWLAPCVTFAEKVLAPFNRWIALQHTIVLRKRPRAAVSHAA
jgi:SAM-dependent methyltransferase